MFNFGKLASEFENIKNVAASIRPTLDETKASLASLQAFGNSPLIQAAFAQDPSLEATWQRVSAGMTEAEAAIVQVESFLASV